MTDRTPATPVAETEDIVDWFRNIFRPNSISSGDVSRLHEAFDELVRLRTLTESSGTSEGDYERVLREVEEQDGMRDSPHGDDPWSLVESKIVYKGKGQPGFGHQVVVEWDWGYQAYGYLTCLPGHHEDDMQAVIHLPSVMGEKEAEPWWGSLIETALLPGVRTVTFRAPSESSEREAVDRIALHNEGYTAQERGVPATSNPHPRGTISRDLWRLGWIEAGEPVDTTEGGA